MAVIKVKELLGISSKSFDDAFNQAIEQVIKQKKNVTGAQIISQNVSLKDNKIDQYKVNVKVAYKWEDQLHDRS